MIQVLIAAPTHLTKEYARARWEEALSRLVPPRDCEVAFRYQSTDALTAATKSESIALGMEAIRWHMLSEGFDWWLNVEEDVIVPALTLKTMLWYATTGPRANINELDFIHDPYNPPIDWLAAPVPLRGSPGVIMHSSFSCSLFSRELVEACPFTSIRGDTSPDGWYLLNVVKAQNRFNVVNLPPGYLTIEHLDDPVKA